MLDLYDEPAYRPRGQRSDSRPWLMVYFRCCHAYARMYRNAAKTQYVGRCPHCGGVVRARIGPGGTTRRMFEAV